MCHTAGESNGGNHCDRFVETLHIDHFGICRCTMHIGAVGRHIEIDRDTARRMGCIERCHEIGFCFVVCGRSQDYGGVLPMQNLVHSVDKDRGIRILDQREFLLGSMHRSTI